MIRNLLILSLLLFSFPLIADQKKTDPPVMSEEISLEFDYSFIEGVRCKILEDYRAALSCFERCMKIYAGSAAVRYEISSILLLVDNNYDLPLQLMREAVKIEPDNIWYQLLLATVFQKKSMIDEAGDVYLGLIKKDPEAPDFYFICAELYISVEKWGKAIEVLNRYENQFGITETVSIEKARLYNRQGDLKKASNELTRLIKKYPDNSDYVGLLAELYLDNNQEKKGLSILNKMLSKDPGNGFIQFYLTDYYFEKGETPSALIYLKQALQNDELENEFKVQYLLKLLVKSTDFKLTNEEVFEYIVLLKQRYPDDLPVSTLYADFLKRTGKLEECRSELETILSKDKNNILLWEELLLLYNELNDTSAMRTKGEECIRYFPDEPLPYVVVALPVMMQEKYAEAVGYFEKGLEVSLENTPIRGQFYAYLGNCYYHMDSVALAFNMFDEALKINPNDALILNNYSYYLSLRDERLDEAEKMSSKTIAVDPGNPTFLDTYAWVLYKRKDYHSARIYIRLAIEKSEHPSAVLYEHYGDILFMNGEKEEAVKMWEKAMEAGDDVSDELAQKIKHGIPLEK